MYNTEIDFSIAPVSGKPFFPPNSCCPSELHWWDNIAFGGTKVNHELLPFHPPWARLSPPARLLSQTASGQQSKPFTSWGFLISSITANYSDSRLTTWMVPCLQTQCLQTWCIQPGPGKCHSGLGKPTCCLYRWDPPCFIQNNKEHCVDVNTNSGDHRRDPGTRGRDAWAAVDWAGASFCQLSSSTGVSERGLFLCMKSQS